MTRLSWLGRTLLRIFGRLPVEAMDQEQLLRFKKLENNLEEAQRQLESVFRQAHRSPAAGSSPGTEKRAAGAVFGGGRKASGNLPAADGFCSGVSGKKDTRHPDTEGTAGGAVSASAKMPVKAAAGPVPAEKRRAGTRWGNRPAEQRPGCRRQSAAPERIFCRMRS